MHYCQVCSKAFARCDHVTRHMRSHQGTRAHRCSECGKSFTRSDVLSRHEALHERRMNSSTDTSRESQRPMRASQACYGCASSKTRCDDIKPCQRCKVRGMVCTTSEGDEYSFLNDENMLVGATEDKNLSSSTLPKNTDDTETQSVHTSSFDFADTVSADSLIQHKSPQFPELGFGSSHPFDHPHPGSDLIMDYDLFNTNLSDAEFRAILEDTSNHSVVQPHVLEAEAIGGYTASEKSCWGWQPKKLENTFAENPTIAIADSAVANSLEAGEALSSSSHISLSSTIRDRILGVVVESLKLSATSISGFPSTKTLDYLLQIFFHSQNISLDKWIHEATFDPTDVPIELLISMAAAGAQVVAEPSVWKVGLALQESARLASMALVEADNSNSRNCCFIQAVRLCVDIGIWSGSVRKMEIAEGIEQAVITMLRRSGAFGEPFYTVIEVHPHEDEQAVDTKWRRWACLESFKRVTLHSFMHDMQSSIVLHKGPLTTLVEYTLPVPAAEALWTAASPGEWRDLYTSLEWSQPLPSIAASLHNISLESNIIDVDLTDLVLLYGFWPQIWALKNTQTLHNRRQDARPLSESSNLWFACQYESIYTELQKSQQRFLQRTQCKARDEGVLISEILLMLLHMPDVDLQCLAGKLGASEAHKAFMRLRKDWFSTREARCAVWHAGQVFRAARSLQPALIRGFYATAVYKATLCLWAYGIIQREQDSIQSADLGIVMPVDRSPIVLDSPATPSRKSFIDFAQGLPVLTCITSTSRTDVSLTDHKQVMEAARGVLRNRFSPNLTHHSAPASSPLIVHLESILKDLGEITEIP